MLVHAHVNGAWSELNGFRILGHSRVTTIPLRLNFLRHNEQRYTYFLTKRHNSITTNLTNPNFPFIYATKRSLDS